MNFSDATDIRLGSSTITALYYGSTLIWPKTPPTPPTPTDWSTEYLQVEALEPLNLTTNIKEAQQVSSNTTSILYVQYSTDKTNWYAWNENISISMNTGDIVYFKGSYNNYYSPSYDNARYNILVTTTNRFNVKGNIMSLIYGDNFVGQTSLAGCTSCFRNLFNTQPYVQPYNYCGVVNADNLILPATTLSQNCYMGMFCNCTSLITTPILPATSFMGYENGQTILTGLNYESMFENCTSLTAAPALPATTIGNRCYRRMFKGCASLTTAPALPATSVKISCYEEMFMDCTSLTTGPSILPATTLKDTSNYTYYENCYYGMFMNCTSLIAAPELPATELAPYCYANMFRNCTSLINAPELPATPNVNYHSYCYTNMFNGCSSLNYIKTLSNSWNSDYSEDWVRDVAVTGTFIKKSSNNMSQGVGYYDSDEIPLGWTVQNV